MPGYFTFWYSRIFLDKRIKRIYARLLYFPVRSSSWTEAAKGRPSKTLAIIVIKSILALKEGWNYPTKPKHQSFVFFCKRIVSAEWFTGVWPYTSVSVVMCTISACFFGGSTNSMNKQWCSCVCCKFLQLGYNCPICDSDKITHILMATWPLTEHFCYGFLMKCIELVTSPSWQRVTFRRDISLNKK